MAISSVGGAANTYETTATSNASNSNRLSEPAQNYLSELTQKYPGVNVTVTSFSSENQSLGYMLGSSGNNNLVIAPNILNEMATDPAAAAKYERVFTDLKDLDKRMKEYEKSDNCIVYASGAQIDRNGKVSFWGVSGDKEPRINPGTVYKEKIQKQLSETREKDEVSKKQQKRLEEAQSRRELLEKMRDSDKRGHTSEVRDLLHTLKSGQSALDLKA